MPPHLILLYFCGFSAFFGSTAGRSIELTTIKSRLQFSQPPRQETKAETSVGGCAAFTKFSPASSFFPALRTSAT